MKFQQSRFGKKKKKKKKKRKGVQSLSETNKIFFMFVVYLSSSYFCIQRILLKQSFLQNIVPLSFSSQSNTRYPC